MGIQKTSAPYTVGWRISLGSFLRIRGLGQGFRYALHTHKLLRVDYLKCIIKIQGRFLYYSTLMGMVQREFLGMI